MLPWPGVREGDFPLIIFLWKFSPIGPWRWLRSGFCFTRPNKIGSIVALGPWTRPGAEPFIHGGAALGLNGAGSAGEAVRLSGVSVCGLRPPTGWGRLL